MNKPVAWIDEQGEVFSNPLSAMRNQAQGNLIPLYTHPAELTDEEIIDLINKHIDYVPDEDNGMKLVGVMDFAKAILRKAQEK